MDLSKLPPEAIREIEILIQARLDALYRIREMRCMLCDEANNTYPFNVLNRTRAQFLTQLEEFSEELKKDIDEIIKKMSDH